MPTDNELDDHLSSHPQMRKAEIRRVLNELVALGLIEVRTDQYGEKRYYVTEVGAACHFPEDMGRHQ